MRRTLLFPVIFLCLPLFGQYKDSAYLGLYDSETTSRFRSHAEFLSSPSREGRKAGSEGEREAAIYVTDILAEYGVDILSGPEGDLFGMKQADGDTLTSRNVIGYIPGYDRALKNKYIVIGARLDNLGTGKTIVDGEEKERIFYGANGNASGLAMLLELASRLKTNEVLLKRSVLLIAFGASLEMNAGSWYFLNRSFPDVENIDAMINLDMVGTGSSGFYAYTSSNAELNNVMDLLKPTLQPVHPQVVSKEPVASDHRSFYDKQIPSVLFTTGMYPEYNSDRDTPEILQYDDMEREMEYVYNFSLQLVNGRKLAFKPEDILERRLFDRDVVAFHDCDTKPSFLGSDDPRTFLSKWVYVYLKYPPEAVRDGIQGRVLVDFIIDEKGKVTNVKVAKGVDPLLDDEAVRVVSASPDWKPARVRGQKVKCALSIYVEFKLEKKKR
ncbi:MAG: TonB family protein [Bacteroidales bacterium]|nr:TonB family protein [Bacteroidales bacterium]